MAELTEVRLTLGTTMSINPDLHEIQELEAHKQSLYQYTYQTTLADFKNFVLKYVVDAYNAQTHNSLLIGDFTIAAVDARDGYDIAFMMAYNDMRIRLDFVSKVYVETLALDLLNFVIVPPELSGTVTTMYAATGIIGKNLFENSLLYVRHHYDVPAYPYPNTYPVQNLGDLNTYEFSPNGGVFNADLTNPNSFTVSINTNNVPDGTELEYAFSYTAPLSINETTDPFGTPRTNGIEVLGKCATTGTVIIEGNMAIIDVPYIGNVAVAPNPVDLGYPYDSAFRIELSRSGEPVLLSAINNIHIVPPNVGSYFSIDSTVIDRRTNGFTTVFNILPAMENGTDIYTWSISHITTTNSDFHGRSGTSGVVTNNRSFPITLDYTNNVSPDSTFTIKIYRNNVLVLESGIMALHNPEYNPSITVHANYDFVTDSSVRIIDVESITPEFTQQINTVDIPDGTVVDYVIEYISPLVAIYPDALTALDPFGITITDLTGPVGPSGTITINDNTATLTLPFVADPVTPTEVLYKSNFGFKINLSIGGVPVKHSGGITYTTGLTETNNSYFDINSAVIDRTVPGFKVTFHSKLALTTGANEYHWATNYRNGLDNSDFIAPGWSGNLTSLDGWTLDVAIPYANKYKEDCQYQIVLTNVASGEVIGTSGWYTLHNPTYVVPIPLPSVFYIPTVKYNFDDPSLLANAVAGAADVAPWGRDANIMPNFLQWPIVAGNIIPTANIVSGTAHMYIEDLIPTNVDTHAVIKMSAGGLLLGTANLIIGNQSTISRIPCDYRIWTSADMSTSAPTAFNSAYFPGCLHLDSKSFIAGHRAYGGTAEHNSVISKYSFLSNDASNSGYLYNYKYTVMRLCDDIVTKPVNSALAPQTSYKLSNSSPNLSNPAVTAYHYTFGPHNNDYISSKILDMPSIYVIKHPNITMDGVSRPTQFNIMHFSHAHIACHNVGANVWIPIEYRDPATNAVLPSFYNSALNSLLRSPNEPSGYEPAEYITGVLNSTDLLAPYNYAEKIVGCRRFSFTTFVAGASINPPEIAALLTTKHLDRCVHGFGVFPVGTYPTAFKGATLPATKYNYVNVVMYIDTTDEAAPYGKLVVLIKTIDPFELMGQTLDPTYLTDTYKCLTSASTGFIYNQQSSRLELFAIFKWCNQTTGSITNTLLRLDKPITVLGSNNAYEVYKTDLVKAMPTPIKLANGNRFLMNLQPANGATETAGASVHVDTSWSYITGAMTYLPSELSPDNQLSLTVGYVYPLAQWNTIKDNFTTMPNINANISRVPLSTALTNPIGSDWNVLPNVFAAITAASADN